MPFEGGRRRLGTLKYVSRKLLKHWDFSGGLN